MNEARIRSIHLLTREECAGVAAKVRKCRNMWTPRANGLFHTFGASAYVDEPEQYTWAAYTGNAELTRHFGSLIQYVAEALEAELGKPTLFLVGLALPGFHIFESNCNGVSAHIHTDEPEDRIPLPELVVDTFTFTLPVEVPGEAGINFYPDGEQSTPEYVPYELGRLYLHSGKTLHQIANPVMIRDDQARITLQGHGVELASGRVALYF